MEHIGSVRAVSGPVVRGKAAGPVRMYEVAYVGDAQLMGEVVRIRGDEVDIQVYENTDGVTVGERVLFSGGLLTVRLGPGLLGKVLDGIGRPLATLGEKGVFIPRGEHLESISSRESFPFMPRVNAGDAAEPGDCIGEVQEGAGTHPIHIPPRVKPGEVRWIAPQAELGVTETVVTVDDTSLSLSTTWPVREPRPAAERLHLQTPLVTGQRVIDTLFPVAKGGAAVVPGSFGTGKTVTQQSLAKWCDADIIVYIGCGERGNEMTEVLEEFPELEDPHTGRSLMERMVLIANTSNMPVAAREASIYLGMTIAEYFRDLGRDVAIMADSTSRWAEALREIAGRMEEMPGEEGYPAYLGSRLAQYYERAGRVRCLGSPEREGSITVINAVSPPGGDFSEPVTQASLRLSGAFWALDKSLAQQRHFPSINWRSSYSLFEEDLRGYYDHNMESGWREQKSFLRTTLNREKELLDLVQLVGRDGLSESDKWVLHLSELLRSIFLQQNAFEMSDAYCSPRKQQLWLSFFMELHRTVEHRIGEGLLFEQVPAGEMRREFLRFRELDAARLESVSANWLEEFRQQLQETEVIPS
ncbi:MAG: V-type ATP synthase subunit A [Synergistales bacterium]|nr:V-type ATP synthase subunit A [Synergistales bacterium]